MLPLRARFGQGFGMAKNATIIALIFVKFKNEIGLSVKIIYI